MSRLSRSLQAVDEVVYGCKYRHCLRPSRCTDHHLEYYCPGKAAQSSLTLLPLGLETECVSSQPRDPVSRLHVSCTDNANSSELHSDGVGGSSTLHDLYYGTNANQLKSGSVRRLASNNGRAAIATPRAEWTALRGDAGNSHSCVNSDITRIKFHVLKF